jgi:predicted membrane metal-binding protein
MDNRPKLLRHSAWTSFFLGNAIITFCMVGTTGASEPVRQALLVMFVFGFLIIMFSAVTLLTTKK